MNAIETKVTLIEIQLMSVEHAITMIRENLQQIKEWARQVK